MAEGPRVEAIRRGRPGTSASTRPRGPDPRKGQFQLRWYKGSRAVYRGVGHDFQEAIRARDNQIADLEAERAAKMY
jgi:hypothetical protein